MQQQQNYSILLGFWSFYVKEVKRFIKAWGPTILGPIITTSLFLLVFVVAMQGATTRHLPDGFTYSQFLIPGLVMMAIIQNSFLNTSSSIILAKINGTIVDTLMVPMSASLIILAYMLGSVTRGIMVGGIILLYSLIFVNLTVHSIFLMLYYTVLASALLGLIGILAGVVCTKFDQLSNFTNIFIIPMSFLSGTFYSTKQLPETVQSIVHYNPFFYMIDGFRYSFMGVKDFSTIVGAGVLLVITIALFLIVVILWNKGYKIKS